ncbi:helix-turn-helix transcriptional regulator [Knoellia sp. 3-2P3]|uniref:helix-turn-helix domain-containing protein n=1 Tax=unclassified Knoellia TaxID=2618719 RepID=UPI0023DCDBC8|nr:helix-turn-helix transcriptional regulator [Knoellia sp. 3-2P3]MDF2093613.1 helix-turn-helix transcriptional regulator [Knoellia sp. 3-2P3]
MEASERKTLGDVIRSLREASGMTRPELAKTAGVGVDMVAKVEQGAKAPSAKTLRGLATALGVEPIELSSRAATWAALSADKTAPADALRRVALGATAGPFRSVAVSNTQLRAYRGIKAIAGIAATLKPSLEDVDRRQVEDALRALLEERLRSAETTIELLHLAQALEDESGA